MKRTSSVVALLAVSLLLLTAGCYTVLRHPTGSVVAHEGSQYRTCADCHADAAYYHPYSRPYYGHGRSQYGSQYGWSGYYGSPWWYDDYWWWDDPYYDHDYDHDYDGPEVETGTRHLWSSDGWASGGWGFTKPGGSVRRPTPPPTPPRQDTGKEDEDKKKDDEKKEDTRNLWKKPKKGF